jgi:S-adenosylmethionine-diacylglycerol 3-amino-3-carboxypropyl transferase
MSAGWIDEALRMPVAFAQVREDPRVDLAVVERLGRGGLSGLMIASGGCTVAALVASGRFADLHGVDANPAQLALTGLKLGFLQHASPQRRRELLGHEPYPARGADLAALFERIGVSHDVFGPPEVVTERGPDHAGRYELLFARLREVMAEKGLADWPALLSAPGAAAEAVAPLTSLGRAFDESFEEVMALDYLVALFGAAATQNSVQPFSRHFAERTRQALAYLPTHDNPFLWQLLAGRFPPQCAYDWLDCEFPWSPPKLTWSCAMMNEVLASSDERRYDFLHLSNILDWLTESEARAVLRLAHRALKPSGIVTIRQLNSTLDVPALGAELRWLSEEADELHRHDRSFFYRRLHLGRREQ